MLREEFWRKPADMDIKVDIKQELREYRALLKRIERLSGEMEMWQALAERVTGLLHPTSYIRGVKADAIEESIEACDEIKKQIAGQMKRAARRREYLAGVVERIASVRQKTVIEMRYFDCFSWAQIAEKMSYSIDHIYRLHGRALGEMRRDLKFSEENFNSEEQ